MAIPLTETANFDAQVIVPQDGLDDESAASLVPAFQSLADRTRALKFVLDLLTAGGTSALTDDLTLSTPTGKVIRINNLIANSTADSGTVVMNGVGGLVIPNGGAAITGAVTVAGAATIGGSGNITNLGSDFVRIFGRLQTPRALVRGGLSGTTAYDTALVDHVFSKNATLVSGVVWQIANNPSGADNNFITFVNIDTTPVTIKNPAGTGINTLVNTPGNNTPSPTGTMPAPGRSLTTGSARELLRSKAHGVHVNVDELRSANCGTGCRYQR